MAVPSGSDREAGRSDAPPHLLVTGVSKRFGGVEALRDVTFETRRGEVMALVGDNGAGKSTLMKIVAGALHADTGSFALDGTQVQIASPHDTSDLGIRIVYQDLALCENLDVAANLALGAEPVIRGWKFLPRFLRPLDELAMEETARRAFDRLQVRTLHSVRARVGNLSGGQRQAIAIARAVGADSSVVLLDEPTAALGIAQTIGPTPACSSASAPAIDPGSFDADVERILAEVAEPLEGPGALREEAVPVRPEGRVVPAPHLHEVEIALPARGLVGALPAQVDAPAHPVRDILQGAMGDQLVDEEHAAQCHLAGHRLLAGKVSFGDGEIPRLRVAALALDPVPEHARLVGAPLHLQAARLHRHVEEGDPGGGLVRDRDLTFCNSPGYGTTCCSPPCSRTARRPAPS